MDADDAVFASSEVLDRCQGLPAQCLAPLDRRCGIALQGFQTPGALRRLPVDLCLLPPARRPRPLHPRLVAAEPLPAQGQNAASPGNCLQRVLFLGLSIKTTLPLLLVGLLLPFVGLLLPLVGRSLPPVGRSLPLVGRSLPFVSRALPLVSRALPLVGHALN